MSNLTCNACGRLYPGGAHGGHCTACHESFSSDRVSDLHRVGRYEPEERRCLTVAEIDREGMGAARSRLLGSTGYTPGSHCHSAHQTAEQRRTAHPTRP